MTTKEISDECKDLNAKFDALKAESEKQETTNERRLAIKDELASIQGKIAERSAEVQKIIRESHIDLNGLNDGKITQELMSQERMENLGKDLITKRSIVLTQKDMVQSRNAILTTDTGLITPKSYQNNVNSPVGAMSRFYDSLNFISVNGGDSFEIPYAIDEVTANKTAEGIAPTASHPSFGTVSLRRGKYSILFYASDEFKRFAPSMYLNYIIGTMQNAMKKKIIDCAINGNGTENNFTGIMLGDDTVNKCIPVAYDQDVSALDKDFVGNAVLTYGGDEDVDLGASFLLSKADLKNLYKVAGVNKQRAYDFNFNTKTIDTIPYVTSSKVTPLATATTGGYFGAYGDFSKYIVGVFSDFTIRFDESCNFVEGLTAYKAEFYAGGVCGTPKSIMRFKKSA